MRFHNDSQMCINIFYSPIRVSKNPHDPCNLWCGFLICNHPTIVNKTYAITKHSSIYIFCSGGRLRSIPSEINITGK